MIRLFKDNFFLSLVLCITVFFQACNAGSDSGASVSASSEEEVETYSRIVSLSGAITETLFALDLGDKVVGIDVTSTYPAEALKDLAPLGHVSRLNVEALLALQPDLVLVEESQNEQPTLEPIRAAGIPVKVVADGHTLERPLAVMDSIGGLFGKATMEKLTKVKADYKAQVAQVEAILSKDQADTEQQKVLFIYARGQGSMMVAGTGTPAESIIELAGAKNAVSSFEGFKALSPESLIEAQPDVLLLFESGLKSLGGVEGLLKVPGLAETPAGRNKHIIAMDGLYLLGFTPRAPQAALELSEKIDNVKGSEI
ncbi:MAG: helical backbone metal receptor [Bacteroidota bacterium]